MWPRPIFFFKKNSPCCPEHSHSDLCGNKPASSAPRTWTSLLRLPRSLWKGGRKKTSAIKKLKTATSIYVHMHMHMRRAQKELARNTHNTQHNTNTEIPKPAGAGINLHVIQASSVCDDKAVRSQSGSLGGLFWRRKRLPKTRIYKHIHTNIE